MKTGLMETIELCLILANAQLETYQKEAKFNYLDDKYMLYTSSVSFCIHNFNVK